MLKYRDIFYRQYYSSQLGRDESNYKQKLREEGSQFRREIGPLLPMDRNISVLDIGCGIGSLVHVMISSGFKNIAGVDISDEMVKVAHSLGIAQVEQGDIIQYMDQHKQSYDLILGMDIIEHFTKDELVALLFTVRASLKPGGFAIFRTPNADAPFASIFANGDFTHENFMNASSAKQVCMNCGFSQVEVLPSLIRIQNPFKEMFRKIIWTIVKFRLRLELFASGRSTKDVILTPNMIIRTKN
jgi:2-polyprenyl-3-methyl-5-hydroxy-6-metoxy-1,4-benzoquinol methylase